MASSTIDNEVETSTDNMMMDNDSLYQDDEIMGASLESLEVLRCQVEIMRNKKQQSLKSSIPTLDEADLLDEIYESSSEFEMGKEDICDTDTDWSDSDVLSLGVKYQPSVIDNRFPASDSESDDCLPLALLLRENTKKPRLSKNCSQMHCKSVGEASTSSCTIQVSEEPEPSTSTITTEPTAVETIDVSVVEVVTASVTSLGNEDNVGKKRVRKRQRQPELWKRNTLKKLRNSGSAYVGFTGKEVLAKKMGPGCGDKCPKKCHQNFEPAEREAIFNHFWKSADINVQRQFIVSSVTKTTPNRVCTTNPESRRKTTLKYSFVKDVSLRLSVCRGFFLDTLDIKQDVVYGALNKAQDGGVISADKRGAHENHATVGDDIVEGIRSHIRSFPTVPSHYCRKDSSKLYLEEGLSVKAMYRMYTETNTAIGKACAKEPKYRDIFNTEFNLAFFMPKKDQCDQCVGFNAIPNPTQEDKDRHADHIHRKEKARSYKAEIKEQAAADPIKVAACFDLQKVLPCPHGQASSFYYKRKLSLYNLTFFDLGSEDVQCYMWPEHVSSRGANQIASCLWDYITSCAERGKSEFNFISDNCAGQNRNRIVAAMFWFALKKNPTIKKIEHGFLEVGHTQNENDSVHAQITKSVKRIPVYTPDQWATVVRGARKNKAPYVVKEMLQNNFMDFKSLSRKIKNLDFDDDGKKVNWTKIRAMIFEKEDNNAMKIVYDKSTHRVDLTRRKRKSDDAMQNIELEQLRETFGITDDKKNDLMSLCQSNLIPPAYHQFFETLPVLKP